MSGAAIIARVKAAKAGASGFEEYAADIRALVAIGPVDAAADLEAVDAAFSLVSLRRRLAALEQKVQELEARK